MVNLLNKKREKKIECCHDLNRMISIRQEIIVNATGLASAKYLWYQREIAYSGSTRHG
jgi:hypothetical protein